MSEVSMPDLGWNKILCPVDFSATSGSALRMASTLARELGAELTLLHVRTIPGSAIPEAMFEGDRELMRDLSAPADQSLASWRKVAEERGAGRVEALTSVGDPAEEITALARRGAFDAIVIATHGRTGLKHVILGSVAEKVVRLAPCVVVSVTAEAANRWGAVEFPVECGSPGPR